LIPAVRTPLLALAALLLLPVGVEAQTGTAPDTLPTDTTRRVRICAGGDVTLGTNLGPGWVHHASRKYGIRVEPHPDPDSLLAPLRPLVEDADVVLLNVEGAIGEGPAPRKCAPDSTQCFAFRQPVETAAALRRLGESAEVVGNVANNHAGDAGAAGLRATIRHLREAGVRVTGADTLPTVVMTEGGDRVVFLGFSTSGGPDPRDLAAVRRHVRRAAERHTRVVVTMHMGAEGIRAQRTRDATEIFLGINRGNSVAFARAAAEAGADLVVGHGPHVMRAVEWHEGALILYSLGNLLTYGPFSLAEPLNRGAVACAALDEDGRVAEAELRPTRQLPPGVVRPDLTGRAVVLADSLTRLDFPESGAVVHPDGRIERPKASGRAVRKDSGGTP
jgi:poly-gamma-glutamate capsule biosynthesis protein CapA/YwtB (metallophosphatase superfamily)